MAGNNSIQILRGNNVKTNTTIKNQTLLDGQPLYDRSTGYLFVGEGNTIANTTAVNAHYANSAGTASSATVANTRNKLYFNGNGSNVSWNGSSVDTIYVPTSVGSSGQVWGVRSNGTVGWVAQTEVPGTIDHANTADVANTANKLSNSLRFNGAYANGIAYNVAWNGTAPDTIYVPTAIGNSGQVWGMKNSTHAGWIDQEEIPGTVENANYANYAGTANNANFSNSANIANSVESNLNIRVMGSNYTYDGGVAVNIHNRNLVASSYLTHRGAIPYASTNGTTATGSTGATPANVTWLAKGDTGQVLTATSTGIAWQTLSTSSLPSFIAFVDNSKVDLPVTASTYMITKVIGANGHVTIETAREGIPTSFGDNSLITIGIRPDANQITISFSNGSAIYSTANSSMTKISVYAPPGTRYVITKLSDV